jgi:putative sigma-54 modulation protein|tara:strand:- start:264 stop:584 length:321 start_codon:yes stop_codon:yes gene_type:complete
MQIELTGHHLDITPAIRNFVNEKFKRLERHFDHVINTHVVLSVEKVRHQAEASMLVSQNKIFANATADDMYVAIDDLIDKLDRQIVKHKEKIKDHHNQEGAHRNLV